MEYYEYSETQCCALTKKGKRCKKRKEHYSISGFCCLHHHPNGKHYVTENDCPICINNIKNPLRLDKCGHEFCTDCINTWMYRKNSCPNCREPIEYYQVSRALLYGMVHKKVLYIYKYTFDSSVLNQTERELFFNNALYMSITGLSGDMELFELNKEYSFIEWERIKKNMRNTYLKAIYNKIPHTFAEYISDYTEEYSASNLIFTII